ncbi:hypothetical protein HY497_02280 [Candidatus Woesearchaeota archaeon]|nr:hypothetical protein [Candidatus Woesearchaeota archaeon]
MAIIEAVAANASVYVPVVLDPVVGIVQKFFTVLSALLGGLFGLYFVFLLIRFFYDRKILNELRAMRRELHEVRKKLKIVKK